MSATEGKLHQVFCNDVGRFREGFADVQGPDGWFHIREEDDKPAYPQRYATVEPFQKDGLVVAWAKKQSGIWVRINTIGQELPMKPGSVEVSFV